MAAHAFVIGEERDTEVEYRGGPGGQQQGTTLLCDIGEPRRDIGSAGKDDRLDSGADRRHCRAGIAAAVEQCAGLRRRNCFPRRAQHFPEPARSGIDAGIGRAGEDNRPPRLRRGAQCRDSVRQRMKDDDGCGFRTAGVTPAFGRRAGGPRSSQAIASKWAATSTMRFEKPHSLSYQDSTRTKVLSSTWVWVTSKVELCESWLKSTDTVAALLIPTMP